MLKDVSKKIHNNHNLARRPPELRELQYVGIFSSFFHERNALCLFSMQNLDFEITVMSQACDDSMVGVMYKTMRLAAMRRR